MLQRSQVMYLTGRLAELRCVLEPRVAEYDAAPALLALYGNACADAGEPGRLARLRIAWPRSRWF